MIKQFLNAMDYNKEYDFIANNYTSMSKAELKNILLEYIYEAHRVSDEVTDNVRETLEANEVFG